MRIRTRVWFLLSAMFLIAAAYFWRLGNERAARPSSQESSQAPAVPTPADSTSAPAQKAPFSSLTSTNIELVVTEPAASALAYQAKNTEKKLAELVYHDQAILLRNA